MAQDIFFSYGHDEYKDFVLKVQKYLEQEGFDVFVDSDKLRLGDNWEYELEQAIVKYEKMIFFITPYAARRPDGYCLNEVAMAQAHDKKVFPVMLEAHIMPLSLIRKQFLDLQSCIEEDGECNDGLFVEQMKYLVEALTSNNDLEHGDIQQKLIKKLKPIDFQLDYAMHGRRIGREWIMDEIDHWLKEKPESKVLWITAEAGYGKSAISAYLARHPKVMSVHFCNYNSPRTQDPRNVIKTLAYNLQAQQIEGYREEIEHVKIEDKTAFELFRDLIANPLAKVNKEGSLYLFVIDALDETLNDENMELITLLGSDEFHCGLPDFVKLIITSRPESQIKQAISKFNPLELEAEREENKDDCEAYIKVRLKELNQDNADKNNALVDIIMKNSSANMLYVRKFFDDDTLDLSQPEKFPKYLKEIYWRFFRRVTNDIDKYDEKLSPILEVMLAYGESIPKLLLQDILGLPDKTLLRQLNMFGSMLRENDEKLDFYHKSLRDWLISKENEDYFVDIAEGEKKTHTFIKQLTQKSYKEEYLEFVSLNMKLLDAFTVKENSLSNLFNLIEIKQNEENISRLFLNCAKKYNEKYYDNDFSNLQYIDVAIKLVQKSLEVVEEIHDNSIELMEIHLEGLQELSHLYALFENPNKSIQYAERCFFIFEEYYQKKPKYWDEFYLAYACNLCYVYEENKMYSKAIELIESSLTVLKYLYQKDSNWGFSYKYLGERLISISEKIDKFEKNVELYERILKLIKIVHIEFPDKYVEWYLQVLYDLGRIYIKMGKVSNSIELFDEAEKILKDIYNLDNDKWSRLYIEVLNGLGLGYYKLDDTLQSIEHYSQSLYILRKLYENDTSNWVKSYSNVMALMAHSYAQIGQGEKILKLRKDRLKILEPFYQKDSNKWKEDYLSALGSLSLSYSDYGEYAKSIELREKYLSIVETLFKQDANKWRKKYIFSIDFLLLMYPKFGLQENVNNLKNKLSKLHNDHKTIKVP